MMTIIVRLRKIIWFEMGRFIGAIVKVYRIRVSCQELYKSTFAAVLLFLARHSHGFAFGRGTVENLESLGVRLRSGGDSETVVLHT